MFRILKLFPYYPLLFSDQVTQPLSTLDRHDVQFSHSLQRLVSITYSRKFPLTIPLTSLVRGSCQHDTYSIDLCVLFPV